MFERTHEEGVQATPVPEPVLKVAESRFEHARSLKHHSGCNH